MKRLLLTIPFLLNATTITTLFDAIKNTPDYKLDNIAINEMNINKESVKNMLYPTLKLNASAEHFNLDNSLVPLTPTESAKLTSSGDSLPFAQNIYRVGFEASMPLFIKSIYDNKKKMNQLLQATKIQSKIELLKKEALIVTYVSKLNYLFSLKQALLIQKTSVQTTLKAMKVGVDVGRIPKFKLLRLQDNLNKIDIDILNINNSLEEIKSQIYKLTKIYLNKPLDFVVLRINKGELIFVNQLNQKLKGSTIDIEVKKDEFLPKVNLKMKVTNSFATAYNTNKSINEEFASIGIYVDWNIFNKKVNSDIQKSKLNLVKDKLAIAKLKKDLKAQLLQIDNSLKNIKTQLILMNKSIKLKEELLKGAKVAFKLNRMSVDEYLQYEDDLTKVYAELANLKAIQNTLKANKALIYGENLERIFK